MNIKNFFKNKTILITGGAGFIGSNLCEFFVDKNVNVLCFDNLETGHRKNISHLIGKENFNFIEGDIVNFKDCQKICKESDFILHQAALGSVPRSIKNPIKSNSSNITGFLNMIYAAKENKIEKFVFAASSSTYGDSVKLPKIEDEIGKPLSPYAITKYVNELYADIFYKTYGLNYIGLRYFNVFGKRQDPEGAYAAVIPKFISYLIHHKEITVNGDGSYSRDFTHIDNVILMNLLSLCTDNQNALNQIYNTACGDRITLLKLVETLKLNLSNYDKKISDVKVIHGPIRDGDVPHSLASIKKAKSLLNYSPMTKFGDGIKKSIDWYWNNLK